MAISNNNYSNSDGDSSSSRVVNSVMLFYGVYLYAITERGTAIFVPIFQMTSLRHRKIK